MERRNLYKYLKISSTCLPPGEEIHLKAAPISKTQNDWYQWRLVGVSFMASIIMIGTLIMARFEDDQMIDAIQSRYWGGTPPG